jgi:hypothetical protein
MMNSAVQRWLLMTVAALALSGGIAACDGQSGWDHPNRELHPAPPPEPDSIASLEELERQWQQSDAFHERARTRRPSAPLTCAAPPSLEAVTAASQVAERATHIAIEAAPEGTKPTL